MTIKAENPETTHSAAKRLVDLVMHRSIWTYARHGHTAGLHEVLAAESECNVDELDDHGVTALMVCTKPSPHCCSTRVLSLTCHTIFMFDHAARGDARA